MSGIANGDTVKSRRFIESLGEGVPTGTKGVMTVSVIRQEIEKVEE